MIIHVLTKKGKLPTLYIFAVAAVILLGFKQELPMQCFE